MLELCRQYLQKIANQELPTVLQPKAGSSDLVQETFRNAHQEFARFRGSTEQELLAWLRCILLNNIANFRRHYQQTYKRQVSREVPLHNEANSSSDGLVGDIPSPSPTPGADARARESLRELDQALEQLPEHYRQVLRLRFEENCSFEEIGRRTERSAEAARKLWVRAIEQLRQILRPAHDST